VVRRVVSRVVSVSSRDQRNCREQHHVCHHCLDADAEGHENQAAASGAGLAVNNCWIAMDLETPAAGLDEPHACGVDPYTTQSPGLVDLGQLAGQVHGFLRMPGKRP
jgi:hypothetical protein